MTTPIDVEGSPGNAPASGSWSTRVFSSPTAIRVVVTAAVVAFTAMTLVVDFGEGPTEPHVVARSVATVGATTIWYRRAAPFAVLAAVSFSHLVLASMTTNDLSLVPALVVALFTVVRYADRKVGLAIAAGTAFVLATATAVFDTDRFLPEFLSHGAVMAAPIALGDAARSRDQRLVDLIDTEAKSRVQAERLRIARDLHDIVAHGLSTISIQSGVAAHLIDQDPDQAKKALEIINATGKNSIEELRVMVGVLRSTDEVPLHPTPTDPNDFRALVEGAANAGVAVAIDVNGAFPQRVSNACIIAVHRIAQEALTNVARHSGAATAALHVNHGLHSVEIQIADEGGTSRKSDTQSTGVGLIGMQERAESLGGTLTAAPTPVGGFRVKATLPYNARREQH